MIEGLKPYSSHRATGVYWLPRVPEHWEIVRSKHVFAERTELARAGDVQLSATQAYGVIPQAEFERRVGRRVVRISMHLDKRSHVEQGDFVISMRSFQGGLERAWASGAIRSSYVVLRPARELDLGYFTHLFKAQPYIKALQATGNFIRDGQDLTFGNFTRVDLPVPPRDEQMAIGRFLDHASRRINQFIRAKKKLIALLNEQKLVIVQRRVLGGLRTQAIVRPSGIRGIGEIPADWDVIPTRYLFRPVTRRDITGTEPKMSMSRHLGLVRSDVLHANRAAQAATAVAFSVCHPGDLVMNKYQAHAGLFGAATERGLITANYSVFAPTERAFAPYFALLYTSTAYRTIFRIASRGVGDGMMPLYTSAFHRVPSVVPPLGEQHEIVTTVERETASISAAIAIIERQLQQIGEYRTRLVADVVTGQLDVRTAAAGLPVVEAEPAPTEIEGDETDIEDGEAA